MMRRRRRGDRVVVDLGTFGEGPDEVGVAWPDEAAFADDEPDPAAVARRARRAGVVGLVVFLVLSAWGATTEIDGRQRTERLLTAPGGVLSLASAPSVAWSTGTESADATAFMPGLVVVRHGTVLHGLDAGTGAERWQVGVGGDPRCGAPGEVVDPLVCWSGPNAAPRVTVVHTDGSFTTRALDAGVTWAAAAPGGGLATLRPMGPKPPDDQVSVAQDGITLRGSLAVGQDVEVRLEDAGTGAVRWQRTIPFQAVNDPWTCGTITPSPSGTQPSYTFTESPPSLSVMRGLIEVDGCGVRAVFTPDGAPTAGGGNSAWWIAEPYVDGGVLEQVGGYQGAAAAASVLHSPDGAVAALYPTQVLNPWATDGTTTDLVLTGSAGVPLTALGPPGTVRWRSTHTYSALLVRTAGVAVLTRSGGGIAAVDLRTGRELWAHLDLPAPDSTLPPLAAFTDGRFVALAMPGTPKTLGESTASATDLVTLDLATGDIRWRITLPDVGSSLVAAEGHLVDTTQRDFTSIDDNGPGGAFVNHSPGTVTALG